MLVNASPGRISKELFVISYGKIFFILFAMGRTKKLKKIYQTKCILNLCMYIILSLLASVPPPMPASNLLDGLSNSAVPDLMGGGNPVINNTQPLNNGTGTHYTRGVTSPKNPP